MLSDTISKLIFISSNLQFDLNCVMNQQFTNMFVSFTVTTNTAIITIINELTMSVNSVRVIFRHLILHNLFFIYIFSLPIFYLFRNMSYRNI
jgi:hypothetical protein